jgi:hypothetical protein
MGVVTCDGFDLRRPAVQQQILEIIATAEDSADMYSLLKPLVDDDALFDTPDKAHATRLILWLAWSDKLKVRDAHGANEMRWFEPLMPLVRIDAWQQDDAFGDALPYATLLEYQFKQEQNPRPVIDLTTSDDEDSEPAPKRRAATKRQPLRPSAFTAGMKFVSQHIEDVVYIIFKVTDKTIYYASAVSPSCRLEDYYATVDAIMKSPHLRKFIVSRALLQNDTYGYYFLSEAMVAVSVKDVLPLE